MIGHRAAKRRSALPRGHVAAVAGGGIQCVVVIDVARGARCRRRRHVHSGQRESRGAVIEGGRSPSRCGVARGTVRRGERGTGSRMHRSGGLLPRGQVALRVSAIGGRNHQAVIVVDVAKIAGHVGVSARQRESGGGVIEDASGPRRNRMAGGAGGSGDREPSRHVIGHCAANRGRALECGLVAAVTIRGIQRVVVADMAGRAGSRCRRHVRPGQRESGDAVIEGRSGPSRGSVAVGAVRSGKRGTGSRVHRGCGSLPGGQMALRVAAGGRSDRQIIVIVDVAKRAGHVRMPTCEQKSCGAVIERGGRPTDRVVAGGTVRSGKCRAGRWVHGIVGGLPGAQVAAGIAAAGRSDGQIVVVVNVAGRARNVRVPIREQESRGVVIEFRIQPVVQGRVAGFAGRGEFCGDVVGIGRLLEIRLMAGIAGRRKAQVISNRRVFVTFLAFHYRVRAEQRKAVEVLLNRLRGNLPAEHRVALRAVRAELTAVNIGVAIGAVFSDVREDGLGVTARTGNFFVHAAQRVPRGVMTKFRNRPNRSPTRVGVAVFAGNIQGTVRTSARLPLGIRRAGAHQGQDEEDEETTDLGCA